ncbi:MAG: PIN domain-containing protein [Acetobacterium sp.]|uniref:PIN domain-containing protein n=1 Tax=Acetobacterium sp. TaxID=1872094 RepID=UPI0032429485
MLDTNILISAIIFKSKIMNELVAAILKDHRLVLSSFVIEELKAVVQRKFKRRSADLDHFLTVLRQKNES